MAIKSRHNIRHSGKFFPAGTVISDSDMDQKSQKRLVDGGIAEYVEDDQKPKSNKAKNREELKENA